MKKIKKALKLNRETLVHLDQTDVLEVAGMSVTRLKNQCITQAPTFCSCHVVNTHCIE
jgi:hypothetical protein